MKIIKFSVPYTVRRDNGTIILDLHEDRKVEVGSEDPGSTNDITKVASEIALDNDSAKTLAKGTLLAGEDKTEGKLVLKILS